MSEKVGPAVFGHDEYQVFLGRELTQIREYSEETANLIDKEIRRLIEEAEERAREILSQHRDKLDQLASLLIEKETLRAEDLAQVLGPRQVRELPMAVAKLLPLDREEAATLDKTGEPDY